MWYKIDWGKPNMKLCLDVYKSEGCRVTGCKVKNFKAECYESYCPYCCVYCDRKNKNLIEKYNKRKVVQLDHVIESEKNMIGMKLCNEVSRIECQDIANCKCVKKCKKNEGCKYCWIYCYDFNLEKQERRKITIIKEEE